MKMKSAVLLKKATIIDPNSPFNKEMKDVLIEKGMIVSIKNEIKPSSNAVVIEEEGLHICPGLFDLMVDFSEPGNEHKETLISGCNASMHGGFKFTLMGRYLKKKKARNLLKCTTLNKLVQLDTLMVKIVLAPLD